MSSERLDLNWAKITTMHSRSFYCGHCGLSVNSEKGFYAVRHGYGDQLGHAQSFIFICHACNRPTFFDSSGEQTPGPLLGNPINNLPDDIENLYSEIRRSTAVGSYTAAVLAARKLLMHIAVSHGANEGKNFATYVKYLSDNHYTPPKSQKWVDSIRTAGNEANHEIKIMSVEDASQVIKLVELILVFNYEYADVDETEDESGQTPDTGS